MSSTEFICQVDEHRRDERRRLAAGGLESLDPAERPEFDRVCLR